MGKGPKHHLKRINAPSHWMLHKMGGIWAPRPTPGGHKLRECFPLVLLLRNRLKFALNGTEVVKILQQRLVQVDGKARTDPTYPAGFMDVVSIPKTKDNFRLLYDTKGRFVVHPIREKEAKFKLCKVLKRGLGPQGVPYVNTHDGRYIRYPHPNIKANDTIKVDIKDGKILKFIKCQTGNLVYITSGANRGRIGELIKIEKHPGSFTIVRVKDITGVQFTTRLSGCFTIGTGHTSLVTLPKGKGVKLTVIAERERQLKKAAKMKKTKGKKKKSSKKTTKKKGKSKPAKKK